MLPLFLICVKVSYVLGSLSNHFMIVLGETKEMGALVITFKNWSYINKLIFY